MSDVQPQITKGLPNKRQNYARVTGIGIGVNISSSKYFTKLIKNPVQKGKSEIIFKV